MAFITGSLIGAGASLIGGYMSSNAAKDAAEAQAASADRAAQLQNEQFNLTRADQRPFLEAGYQGQNRLLDLLGLSGNTGATGYGSANKNFSMADYFANKDPGYEFGLEQGMRGQNASAAARGGLQSGSALKAAQRFGQDYAGTGYQNAFNRYQINRENQLKPLQSLAGQGQTTATTLGQAGQNYATNAGNAYMGAGNAAASGYIGSANAYNSAIGSGIGQYQNNQLMTILRDKYPAQANPSVGSYPSNMGYTKPDYGFSSFQLPNQN